MVDYFVIYFRIFIKVNAYSVLRLYVLLKQRD